MAGRPFRPRCAPVARWCPWLLALGLLAAAVGCGKESEPVYVVKAPEPKAEATTGPLVITAVGGEVYVDRPRASQPQAGLASALNTPAAPQANGFNGNMVGQLFQGG